MIVHFMAERLAIVLHEQFDDARARLVFEARGLKEDAHVQYEFAKLFLDGTSYLSGTWIRHQFFPGMEFKDKNENVTGLQLADLVARPVAEKVLDPASTPARWAAIRTKLCLGRRTAHSILGLKIVPWHERYADMWEA